MPSLFSSSGQTPTQADIESKRKMAQMLAQGAINPNFGPNAAPMTALLPLAMMFASKRAEKQANEGTEKLTSDRSSELAKIIAAGRGTPGIPGDPGMMPATPNDDEGNVNTVIPPRAEIPAVPGSRQAMIDAMIGSKLPEMQTAGTQAMLKEPQGKWEDVQGPRGAVLQRHSITGETKQVVAPETKDKVPDWMKPGWLESQKALAEAKGEGKMSPTAQKELFEADEMAQASQNAMNAIDEALKLNDKAYSGPFANERAIASRFIPGKYEGADAATSMDNIVRGQALESLKAIFGGMPTEGERKILLEMQASLEKTPEQRADILKRAKVAAERRMKFNQDKAQSLRGGSYFKQAPSVQGGAIGAPGLTKNNDGSFTYVPKR